MGLKRRESAANTADGYSYIFESQGREYKLAEYRWPDGTTIYATSVRFSRVTSNVFGNGSRNVFQSGWQSLPSAGPLRRRLIGWFEALKKNGRLATI